MIATVTLNAAVDKTYRVSALEVGRTARVRACVCTAGGKGLNVARVAASLGCDVCATGFLGGHAGDYVEELLAKTPVKSRFLHVPGETRACVNVLDERGVSTELLEPGLSVGEREIEAFRARFDEILNECGVIAISGSLPGGCPSGLYADLVRACREKGRKVLLDTSGETLRLGIAARPTLMKPNADERRQLFGDISPLEAARKMREAGVDFACVSLGAEGALMACGEGAFRCAPPPITARNAIGCGDAMIAAFACGLERGYTDARLLSFAVEVSAASAMNPTTGGLSEDDLQATLGKSVPERL